MNNVLERRQQDFMENLEEEYKMSIEELENWYSEAKKLKLVGDKMKNQDKNISATCSLCGNTSSFDKQSLKASTVTINGCKNVMCCDCEDEMFDKLLNRRMPKKKFEQLIFICAIDEKEELMDLYHKRYIRR